MMNEPMNAKEFCKPSKCFCVSIVVCRTRILFWVPHLSIHKPSLMTGTWPGVFCAVSIIMPWPHFPLTGLQPGIGAQHSIDPCIFSKVIMQTTVFSCFQKKPYAILLEGASLHPGMRCAIHGLPLAGVGHLGGHMGVLWRVRGMGKDGFKPHP